ncbi:suppressor of fused domain protein [Streptomyces sp. NPDC057245]|uniref:suppressor of fused domain protein n=1 Tax=Streptomyces TaxID=1883 RepID=UPI0020A67C7A
MEEPALVTVVTDGLRFQPVTCLANFELACTLRVEQRHIARHFTDSVARRTLARPDSLVQYGFVVENDRPLVNGTRIQALLGCPSPYFRDGFDLLRDESGGITVQTITLLPITSGEAGLVREKGMDAVAELFWDRKPNLLDVTRESVV